MKKRLCLTLLCFLFFIPGIFAQNIGIGTASPVARLHVTDSSVLFSATAGIPAVPGMPPVSGVGRRTLWYPDKAAFRTGYVSGIEWDKDNIGNYSFGSGRLTKASGYASIAMGDNTNATGHSSTAIGSGNIASGPYSTALGLVTTASGYYSTALNYFNTASGNSSVAMGYNTTASNDGSVAMGYGSICGGSNSLAIGYNTNAGGNSSVAMGYNTIASGYTSTAMGLYTTASGYTSTAIGCYVSTSGFTGAFAIGDNSTTTIMPSFVNNGFRARFVGGYRLFTTPITTDGTAIGALLNTNQSSWSAISDVRRKENFMDVDGEIFLKKIAGLHLTSWNYKGQDVRTLRHYGPMAQDFFAAFGRDEIGEIGDDTTINQQDFLGVNLIAIQALEKRTQEITTLKQQVKELNHVVASLQKQNMEIMQLLKNRK